MKADKLRQVANKYVRDLNEPIMDSNLQVKSYISNPCTCGGILYWSIWFCTKFRCAQNWTDAVCGPSEFPTEF